MLVLPKFDHHSEPLVFQTPFFSKKNIRIGISTLSWITGLAAATLLFSGQIGWGIAVTTAALGISVLKFNNPNEARVAKIANAALSILSFASGLSIASLIFASSMIVTAAITSITLANPSLAISAILCTSLSIGYILPITITLHHFAFDVFRSFNNDETITLKRFSPYMEKSRDWIPPYFKISFWSLYCFEMKKEELKIFLLHLQDHKLTLPQILESMGTQRVEREFWPKCSLYLDDFVKIVEFCDRLPTAIEKATTEAEIESLLIELSKQKKEAYELLSLLPLLSTQNPQFKIDRKSFKDKFDLGFNNTLLLQKRKKTVKEESMPAYEALPYIMSEQNSSKLLKMLEIDASPQSPIMRLHQELERCELGTSDQLTKAGILPFKGTQEEQEQLLLGKMRLNRPPETFLSFLREFSFGVFHLDTKSISDSVKKVIKFSIKMFAHISIWFARGYAFWTHPWFFSAGVATAVLRADEVSTVEFLTPHAESISNEETIGSMCRAYCNAVMLNGFFGSSGFLTGRALLHYGRRAQEITSGQRTPRRAG